MFSYLSKVLFSGFFQFQGNFVDGQNNSEYRDRAPLKDVTDQSYPVYACTHANTGGWQL